MRKKGTLGPIRLFIEGIDEKKNFEAMNQTLSSDYFSLLNCVHAM